MEENLSQKKHYRIYQAEHNKKSHNDLRVWTMEVQLISSWIFLMEYKKSVRKQQSYQLPAYPSGAGIRLTDSNVHFTELVHFHIVKPSQFQTTMIS